MADRTRRHLLRGVTLAGLVGLAGCNADSGEQSELADTNTQAATVGQTATTVESQTAELTATDGDSGDLFSDSIAVSNDGSTALFGAPEDEDPNGELAGSAYVFTRGTDGWRQQAKLTPDNGEAGDEFGDSVALSGDGSTALLGAPDDDGPNGQRAGSAYAFRRETDGWDQQVQLTPTDGDAGDEFGASVSLSSDGSTALCGAQDDEDPNGPGSGSAYVFTHGADGWREQAKLTPAEGDAGIQLGRPVVISGDGSTALLSAPYGENSNGDMAGSAYVFARGTDGWREQARLTSTDSDGADLFGSAAALSRDGSIALLGAFSNDSNGRDSGAAYVFTRGADGWRQQAKLTPDNAEFWDRFGSSVALSRDGSTALLSAPEDEIPEKPVAGAAYVFTRGDDGWHQQTKLVAREGDTRMRLDGPVAVTNDGRTAIVGAGVQTPIGENQGSAYVFDLQ